jgi:superfamily II DNA or RNA helicase
VVGTTLTKGVNILAPGARIQVRDAEWLVRQVDRTSTGGEALTVVGLSELVKDKEAIFLTEVEKSIEVLDPVDTQLVQDTSSGYQASLLYMESLLRQTPPTDENLYIGHRAAMDAVPYQMDPTLHALQQPRQRILIADAVGLGKTLEAGILVAELMRRGRGKRILVAAVKSMLTQFQKEFWSRFTIPLTRLDSIGLQRIRSRIPANHNPFYYYDKAIISIDTLKQDAEYRTYLENAYWDIIIIDEAHNVAERGGGASLRARLAKLLATRSDTLIMLSATPHDGRARSFASLMNMLDPTAIADPDDYTRDDIKGLFIRRFKKDIQDQVDSAFKARTIRVARTAASPVEEMAFDAFAEINFTRLDQRKTGGDLFKTTLEKALFSSPAACLETIQARLKRLRKRDDREFDDDIAELKRISEYIERITPEHFSKYQKLLEVIREPGKGFGWTGKQRDDRLVIFTERIETLKFLHKHLPKALGLKDKQVLVLHGTLPDVEQQRIVEDFGREEAPVRLLIASDVASEGINLHFLCHRMIHFDIPWSLMIFQQRNGRIDRYGQERTPQIVYLVTESRNEKIRGDTRILELLIEKDEQAVRNIGDPAFFMGVYDIEMEEQLTAGAIERGLSPEEFERSIQNEKAKHDFDPLAVLMGDVEPPKGEFASASRSSVPSLYRDDYHYLEAGINFLRQSRSIQAEFTAEKLTIQLTALEALRQRFRFLPHEIWPQDGVFVLSMERDAIQKEIARSRKDEKAWPKIHYLWELNPVLLWLNDQVTAAFTRHEAPVLVLRDGLRPEEIVFVISGLIPNRKSHPLVHRWFGALFIEGRFERIEGFEGLLERTGLNRREFPNPGVEVDKETLSRMLPEAVKQARDWMSTRRQNFEAKINDKLNDHLQALERLRSKQHHKIELKLAHREQPESFIRADRERERRRIDKLFDDYLEWIEDTMTTEDNPYLQIVAVLTGRPD